VSDISIAEIAVVLVVALLVFGPDRLPTMVKQAASFVNDLRKMVANARRDLSESVGDLGIDEKDLKTLADLRNPKSFVRQKVLDGVDLEAFGLDEIKDVGDELELTKNGKRRRPTNGAAKTPARSGATGAGNGTSRSAASTSSARATKPATGGSASGSDSGSAAGSAAGSASTAAAVEPTATNAVTSTPSGASFDPDAT
jgi:Tat protein translocase TatB subunit